MAARPVGWPPENIRTSLYTLFFYRKASTESNTDLTYPLPEKIRFLTLPGIFLLSAVAVVLILGHSLLVDDPGS